MELASRAPRDGRLISRDRRPQLPGCRPDGYEAASPSELAQKGWSRDTLKIGDQITVDGFKAKSKPTTASARVIELPGGKKMPAADDSDGGPKSADNR
jgi:hypothetical protein